jgi:hypothetical protein
MRFLDAVLCLALASEIHNSDESIRRVAKSLLNKVPRRHRPEICHFLNSPCPLYYTQRYVASIPDSILTMDPGATPDPTYRKYQPAVAHDNGQSWLHD